MSSRPPNERGPGGSQHDSASPYKRSRPQSPSSSVMQGALRPGAQFYQDPRYGLAVAAVASGGFESIYRNPFSTTGTVDHGREQYNRDRLVASTSNPDVLQQLHKRRPQLLDYHHGVHAQAVDRSRYRPDPSAYGQHFRQDNMGNLQGGPQSGMGSAPDSGPNIPKRPRLQDRPDLAQPLMIDVSQAEPKREPAYNPQVEAISPTLPQEETLKVQKIKEELLNNIARIDREIGIVETQIQTKQKKKLQQEEAANKQKENVETEDNAETPTVDMKHQSIAQIIYAENRKKAQEAHNVFAKMGPKVDLPLYNKPSDAPIYHENKRKFVEFKPKLIQFFKKRHQARKIRERYLTQRYDQLMQVWQKKVEKNENNPKKKAKDAKLREYFEKIFPELKKARDDKDRINRTGTRAGMAPYARSEAEFEQIMDGLHEQEEEERKMHLLAVIPPMMLDARQRSLKFVNKNGLISECMEQYKERRYINTWTPQEKQIFKEKYLQHPKNFGLIASFLEKKNTMDCVQFYYQSKKGENYKQMLRKQSVKKKRQQAKAQSQPVIKEEPMDVVSTSEVPTSQVPSTSNIEDTVNIVTSSAPSGPPVRPDTGPLNIPSSSTGKEKDDDDDDSSDDDNNKAGEGDGGVHGCAICKTQLEHFGLSRPLTSKNCELYGLLLADLKPDMRVCSNCRCKSVRKKYTQCPVPSCKTPKRKIKRLRPFPTRLADLSPEMKAIVMKDLMLTNDINKCCAACFNRIARRLESVQQAAIPGAITMDGQQPQQPASQTVEAQSTASQPEQEQTVAQSTIAPTPQESVADSSMSMWTDAEIELAKKGFKEHGKDWAAIARVVGSRSEAQCRGFYSNFKKKYNLDAIMGEGKEKEDKRTVSTCESVASTMTAPSDGEPILSDNEDNRDSDDSGTASAPSPRPLNIEERDGGKDSQRPDSSRPVAMDTQPSSSDQPIPSNLTSQKPLSTSQGSLRSIPDNDSNATLSADETPGSQADRPPQQQFPGAPAMLGLPATQGQDGSSTSTQPVRNTPHMGSITHGLSARPNSNSSQSPSNSNQGFPSRPGSRQSPATSSQGGYHHQSRPNSRPSSHEVPIIRETNPNQAGNNALDFSQGMKHHPFQQGRDVGGQPHRPSSTMSDSGLLGQRALSPHVSMVAHQLLGLDPSQGTTPIEKKSNRPTTCVRDLIHSAIERNLSQDQPAPDRPRSTDAAYRSGPQQPVSQMVPHDLRATDMRKDTMPAGYPEHRGSPYQLPMRGDPRDMRDPRDIRGPPSGGIDLSMRPSDGIDKPSHTFKGDPRDFGPRPGDPYRGGADDSQRKSINTMTPPPAHSNRRSPFQVQQEAMKGRPDPMDKSPNIYQERNNLSPSVRGAPASSPYSPHGVDSSRMSGKGQIPPPPPLINSSSSPRLPKSPPTSHMTGAPPGSITHGTPVGIPMTNTSASGRPGQQSSMVRGSITQGTPVHAREASLGRGMQHMEQGQPRHPGQYDIRMMEQAQVRGVHPSQMYDPRAMEQIRMQHPGFQQPPYQYAPTTGGQQGEYSTKQTIMSDFVTARQMQMRHQTSPTEKDPRGDGRLDHRVDPRGDAGRADPRDQTISPRSQEHVRGPSPRMHAGYPGMYMNPNQGQPSSSRVSPRPSPNMPSPRDDKNSAAAMWMRPSMSGQGHPSGHIDPATLPYPTQSSSRSITQGTGGRQSVIMTEDRYKNVPDSSGTPHHRGPQQDGSFLQMPTQSGDHRRSPAVHPDYRQQAYERDRQEKEMKEREAKAQQMQRYAEEQQRLKQQEVAEAQAKEDYVSKMRFSAEDAKLRGNLQQPTDFLKAFAPEPKKPAEQTNRGKGGMTAASLIDAIIVHQINQSTEEAMTTDTPTTKSAAMSQEAKPSVTQSTVAQQQQQQMQQQQLNQQQQQQQMRMGQQQQHGGSQPYPQGHPGYRPGGQGYPPQGQGHPSQGQGHPSQGQGHPSQGQGHPSQGQGQMYHSPGQQSMHAQPYPGQPYPQQGKGQQESKSPPAQVQGKKRWMPPSGTPPSTPYPQGAPPKPDGDSKPPSRPSSRGSGGTPARTPPQGSPMRGSGPMSGGQGQGGQGGQGQGSHLTLGDHINTIILMDYERKKEPASGKSFLSQINGSTQQGGQPKDPQVQGIHVSSSSTPLSDNVTSWVQSAPSMGMADNQNKGAAGGAFPGPKKHKWRQPNEQASSSDGQYQMGGPVSQSAGVDDQGSRSQDGDWRHMRPDQSHSPSVTGAVNPASPPGQADSSSSSLSASSVEVKGVLRKGVQDPEVSNVEYVKNMIAQVRQEDSTTDPRSKGHQGQGYPGQGHHPSHMTGPAMQGQITESMQPRGRSPHPQHHAQPSHSTTKQRTQSPVSSQTNIVGKENSHKHARPEPRQAGHVSTSSETHLGVQPRQHELSSALPSSSSQPSPDQHHNQDDDPTKGGNYSKPGSQSQSPVSSAADSRDQVHSSQHSHRKGRIISRPRSRMEQEEQERKTGVPHPRDSVKQSQRVSPSASVQEAGRATTSSDKKGPKSEYDFPDSPDDEALGKPLSSYMALSSSTRSPRRGVVDSSENRGQGNGDVARDGDSNVESSEDVGQSEAKVSDSGSVKDNEAQGFERYSADQRDVISDSSQLMNQTRKLDEGQVSSQVTSRHGAAIRKQSSEADEGSNVSHTSADSTERLLVDELANIDSSSAGQEISSVSQQVGTGSRRGSKSSRESDNSPHCGSSDLGSSIEHVSHSRQTHRSRSPRSYPQSTSDLSSNISSGSGMGIVRRSAEDTEGREQEPQPLLSSQYEILSDDEQS